ncbi:hypothetical protein DYB37_000322 [Aphanomyces astaci]|uniref:GINS subunit domain-containing protein n=2 Tax=Aphanomyces astaci TaxID=112090 RepID=A0A397BNB1_APHAT|nr:hypothetical protein DYB36_011384 [Aphanomyces astaci]RHY21022.1 hypothetical protein DYB25_006301 [Aphanomyces astaci]RHY36938.1 hypothetical protein DYB38_005190 [Aphanomyces astaci]RHY62896.1 hypothetical protein DYB30_001276 [Aphanomyces astaci]RHY67277.1 hypothetical protein DYB34_010894 [Aphanomyces astaci]
MATMCAKAKELLKELGRSEWLPPYNEEGMRLVADEVGVFHRQIADKIEMFDDGIENHPSQHCGLVVSHQCLMRNKRAALAYINHRVNKIKELRWQTGSVVPDNLAPALCAREMQFFHSYDQGLSNYMSAFQLDLSADLQPPKDLYIQVRVVKDCGEIYTENGPVQLHANSTHFLRRADVESLIRQGLLMQIKH